MALNALLGVLPELNDPNFILSSKFGGFPTHIYICVDNQSAVSNACSTDQSPGQALRIRNHDLLQLLQAEFPSLPIEFLWIPSHLSIEGNERADALAKVGASRKSAKRRAGTEIEISVSALKASYQTTLINEWNQEWRRAPTGKALRAIDPNPPSLNVLKLHLSRNRRHNSLFTQLRTDKSNLQSSLYNRKLETTSLCSCGERETRTHFFIFCKLYHGPRQELRKESRSLKIKQLNLSSLLTEPTATHATLLVDSTNTTH